MPRGIHRDAEQLHGILAKGVLLDKDRVGGDDVNLSDPSPVYIGVMFDVEGYGPHIGALYLTQGWGSVDQSLQAADEMLEEWALEYHANDDYIDELQKEWGDEWMEILTETFDGFAFELSPQDFAHAIRGTDAEKFIYVVPGKEEGLEEPRRASSRERPPQRAPATPTSVREYQGWANWETWNVALWFGNDEGLYHAVREHRGKFTAKSTKDFVLEMLPDGTPDFDSPEEYRRVRWGEIAKDFNELRSG